MYDIILMFDIKITFFFTLFLEVNTLVSPTKKEAIIPDKFFLEDNLPRLR